MLRHAAKTKCHYLIRYSMLLAIQLLFHGLTLLPFCNTIRKSGLRDFMRHTVCVILLTAKPCRSSLASLIATTPRDQPLQDILRNQDANPSCTNVGANSETIMAGGPRGDFEPLPL